MNDAVVGRHHAEVGQGKVARILGKGVDLLLRHGVGNGLVLVVRGRVMVGHAENLPWTEALQSPRPHAGKGLGRSHLVAVQAVDIELRRTVVNLLNHVSVPDFVE